MFSFVRKCQCGALSEPLFPKASHSPAFLPGFQCCLLSASINILCPRLQWLVDCLECFWQMPSPWPLSALSKFWVRHNSEGNSQRQHLFIRPSEAIWQVRTDSLSSLRTRSCLLPPTPGTHKRRWVLSSESLLSWSGEVVGGGSFTFLLISVCLVAVNLTIFHSSGKVDFFHCFYAGMDGKFLN